MQAGRDAEKDLAMCEAATDGPWHTQPDGRYSLAIVSVPEQEVICFTDSFGDGVHDGRFISESRTALPHWIQRATMAEEEVKRLKNLIGGVVGSLTAWAFNLEDVNFSAEEYQDLQKITQPLFEEDMTI